MVSMRKGGNEGEVGSQETRNVYRGELRERRAECRDSGFLTTDNTNPHGSEISDLSAVRHAAGED
jgi:hypothetical protein